MNFRATLFLLAGSHLHKFHCQSGQAPDYLARKVVFVQTNEVGHIYSWRRCADCEVAKRRWIWSSSYRGWSWGWAWHHMSRGRRDVAVCKVVGGIRYACLEVVSASKLKPKFGTPLPSCHRPYYSHPSGIDFRLSSPDSGARN